MTRLTRDSIEQGLRELARRAEAADMEGVEVKIIGGAALWLRHFDRATTRDIDADIHPDDAVSPLIEQIAEDFGWDRDWLNGDAAQFVPHWGDPINWVEIYRSESIRILVAPADVLLAMKLNAYEKRTDRDASDVVSLLPLVGITTVDEADELVARYFPGDALGERTTRFLERVFSAPS